MEEREEHVLLRSDAMLTKARSVVSDTGLFNQIVVMARVKVSDFCSKDERRWADRQQRRVTKVSDVRYVDVEQQTRGSQNIRAPRSYPYNRVGNA